MASKKKTVGPLVQALVCRDFARSLLIEDFEEVEAALRGVEPGRREDGQSFFFAAFEGRASRLRLGETPTASLELLRRFDLNILGHQDWLATRRPGFALKYYQYLAAMMAEVWLWRLSKDAVGLALDFEVFRKIHRPGMEPVLGADVWKLAYWMATGSGKTLLMHINILQCRYYLKDRFKQVMVLVPTETLARQHLQELRCSGFTQARHGLEPRAEQAEVVVMEITKLYVREPGRAVNKGGVSLATEEFEGPNLVLVDEGHKGSGTRSDREAERAWRRIRGNRSPPSLTREG